MSTVKNKEVSKTKKINSIIKFNIMAIILIAIFCIALTPVTLQNDTFYTIKIGEQFSCSPILFILFTQHFKIFHIEFNQFIIT